MGSSMKYSFLNYLLLVLFLSLNYGSVFSNETLIPNEELTKIIMPPSSVIDDEEYSLGEISNIEGDDALLVEKMRQTIIGRSPLPGRKLTVTRSLILSRLRSQKIKTGNIVFPGSESSSIQRAALKIAGKDIEQVVLNHIRESNSDNELKPRILAKTRDIFLPRGEVSYVITSKGKHKKEGGYRNYEVEFSIDSEPVRIVIVRTYLKLYKEVFIARDTIRRNQIIEESDLLKVRKNVERMPRKYITDKDQLIGKISNRTINPREAISGNTISSPPIVNSGDRLQIIFETPYLLLSAPGISMAKGRKGERIPVKNVESKVVVFATVKNKNVVMVN